MDFGCYFQNAESEADDMPLWNKQEKLSWMK